MGGDTMMPLLRRILRGVGPTALLLASLAAGLMLWPAPKTAKACWNVVEVECFNQILPLTWPWQHPTNSGRYWVRWPAAPPTPPPPGITWGHQRRYFDTHMCATDVQ